MDNFCGSTFWDSNLTWHTESPDLTSCFEQTVLVWTPNIFLILFLPLDLFITFNSKHRDVPWSWKNISKLIVIGVLMLISLIDFIYVHVRQSNEALISYVHVYTPIIKFGCLGLCFYLLLIHKKWGQRSSGLLCLYWLLVCVLGIPQFRTDLRALINEDLELPVLNVTFLISYCLSLVMTFLNLFADSQPRDTAFPSSENPCPESSSSFPSRLTFTWFDKMAYLGWKKPLVTSDLWHLNNSEQTKTVSPQFEKYWRQSLAKQSVSKEDEVGFIKRLASVEFVGTATTSKKKFEASIVGPLWKAFGSTFLVGAALKLLQDLLSFISPQILSLIIDFVECDPECQPMWRGYFLSVILFLNTVIQSLILSQYSQKMFLVGLHIRTSLMSAIYRKAFKISNESRKESAIGEIVNLMAVDAQRFMELTNHLNMFWSIPLQIGLAVFFLWQLLGPSVLAGMAALIIMIPLNALIANKVEKLQSKQMETKDERVKCMNEILSGIKVLKLYAWEPSFEHIVHKIREKEVRVLKYIAYYMASVAVSWTVTPFLVGFITFVTYILVDENNVLDAKIAFVSLSLLHIVRVPLAMLPVIFMDTIQAWVSVKRINKFLNLEELNPDFVKHDTNEEDPLVMEKCTFSWESVGEIILKDISLRVKEGSLVAVVGAVGSGKSSLLSAFLGEMEKISGRVNTKGSIAYVPQIAWIQNATLKDNILFGKPCNERKYNRIIKACALAPDLEILAGGDQTEIGEKGINISGGQKQRVSLARAVYHDCDVYLLDDPLSAVDSHVGKHIFQDVIGPTGVLKKKTRIFVTHSITFLPEVDIIVVLSDKTILEMGTYQELMERKGAFSEFIMTYLQETDENEDDNNLNEIKMKFMESQPELSDKLTNRVRQKSLSSETGSTKSLRSQRSSESSASNNMKSTSTEITGEKLIEEEKAEIGQVKFSIYLKYFKAVGYMLGGASIFLFILYQGLMVGTNIWLAKWTGDTEIYVNGTRNDSKLAQYIEIYGVFGVCLGLVSPLTDLLPVLGGWRAAVIMHNKLLFTIFRLPLSFFDTTPSGRILSRFSRDIDILDSVLPRNFADCSWCFFDTLGTLSIIIYSTPIFVVTIVPISVIYYFVQKFYIAASRQLNRLESISRSPIFSHFSESVTGAPCIRAFNVEERFISESEEKIDNNVMCYFPSLVAHRWLAVRLELVANLCVLFASLFAVQARGVIEGGIAGLSVSYSLQITELLNWLVRISSDVEINIVGAERIKEYAENKQEAPWEVEGEKVSSSWPEKGEVELKDFKVRYREGLDFVLKGINFNIKGGEKVGVVGRTGAGKSSLTLSLFRIIEPAGGSIRIDGLDISNLGLHTLRCRLTIIPQDPVLFSGSLRMNLDPFEKHTDEQVWRALELAHLKDFVKGVNVGLQYEVTEGGENFSVGQRQLICLARALLRKTKILILDEATAAVDLETDDLIQKTIRSEFADCTVLTIAHRINTIMDSDRVIVLDRGTIVEFDSPENLMHTKDSLFYSMAHDAGLA